MKKSAIAAMVLLLSVAAAEARTEWRGPGKLIDINQTCIDVGWTKGAKANLRFRPSGMSDNGNRSQFATHLAYFAFGASRDGRFSGALRGVQAFGVAAGGYGPVPGTKFRFVSFSPANFTETTPKITVVAEFTNYGGDIGCTARWRGTLKRKSY